MADTQIWIPRRHVKTENINYQKMLAYHNSSLHIIFQFQFIYDQKKISLTFNTLHT